MAKAKKSAHKTPVASDLPPAPEPHTAMRVEGDPNDVAVREEAPPPPQTIPVEHAVTGDHIAIHVPACTLYDKAPVNCPEGRNCTIPKDHLYCVATAGAYFEKDRPNHAKWLGIVPRAIFPKGVKIGSPIPALDLALPLVRAMDGQPGKLAAVQVTHEGRDITIRAPFVR